MTKPGETSAEADSSSSSDRLTWQLARGGGLSASGRFLGKALQFFLQILLGRSLGVSGYGLYALGFSAIGLVSPISTLGMGNGVVRFVSACRGEGDDAGVKGTLIAAIVVLLASTTGIGALLLIGSGAIAQHAFQDEAMGVVLGLFAVSLPFLGLVEVSTATARAFLRMEYDAGVRDVILPLGSILFIGIAIAFGWGVTGAVAGYVLAAFVAAGVGLWSLRRLFPPLLGNLRPRYDVKPLMRFSVVVWLSGLTTQLVFRVDRLMLGWLRPTSDVGTYSAAASLALQLGLVIQALCQIADPLFADLHNRQKTEELKHVYQTATRWGITLSLPVFVTMVFHSRELLGLFGGDFRVAGPSLLVLAVGGLAQSVRGPTAPALRMTGRERVELLNTVSLMILNIGLNALLIPIYGPLGAAVATSSAILVLSVVRLVEVRMLLGLSPYNRRLIKPLVAGLLVSLLQLLRPVSVLRHSCWPANVVMLLVIYFGTLWLLGIEPEERLLIARLLQWRRTNRDGEAR